MNEKGLRKYLESYSALGKAVTCESLIVRDGGAYLSGNPYVWSAFRDKAFVFACHADADHVVRRFLPDGECRVMCFGERKPARDPLVIATEKAYRASNQYKIDKLLKLEKRYAGRLKLAEAGLAKTRRQIRSLLIELAKARLAERSQ